MSDVLGKITSVSMVQEIRTVDLGDFHESYRGAIFEVWVTPTKAHQAAFTGIQEWLAQANERVQTMLRQMNEQHQQAVKRLRQERKIADIVVVEANYQAERSSFDEQCAAKMRAEFDERLLQWLAATCLNWDEDELRQARDHLQEINPAAWEWLWNRITATIGEYKRDVLKN